MKSIRLTRNQVQSTKAKTPGLSIQSLITKYQEYASRQKDQKVYWYMKAIIILPCVVMVPTVYLMCLSTDNFIWFIAVSMLLFFANVIVHIAEVESRLYVPVYHLSILIMVLIPTIKYILPL